jgi:hypothetical protein
MKPDKIQHYHYFGYYDGPLDGILRAKGKYWYFQRIEEPTSDYWGFAVLDLPPEAKLQYLKKAQYYRHHWGWHSDVNANRKYPKMLYRENHIDFHEYDYEHLDSCTVVGFTSDLKNVYFR